jgi:hypothetical protein
MKSPSHCSQMAESLLMPSRFHAIGDERSVAHSADQETFSGARRIIAPRGNQNLENDPCRDR